MTACAAYRHSKEDSAGGIGAIRYRLRPVLLAVRARFNLAHRRVLCFNAPPMVAGIKSYLYAAGVDVAQEVERGALVFSSSEDHLMCGRFDPDRMITLLDEAVTDALRDGYDGLWAAGDMTWEFGPEKNFEKLQYYERELEALFERRPELQGICQYHMDTLPPTVAAEALHLHRACYINNTLSRMNRHREEETILNAHVRAMLAQPDNGHRNGTNAANTGATGAQI